MRLRPGTALITLILTACGHSSAGGDRVGIEAVEVEGPAADSEVVKATDLPPPPMVTAPAGGGESPGPWREGYGDADTPVGMAAEDELDRLADVLGSLRASLGERSRRPLPPRAVLDAWERMLRTLDRYFDEAPKSASSVQLVRMKVSLESELDLDMESWRIPGHLRSRVKSRLALLEQKIAMAREDVASIPDGDLSELLAWPIEPVVVTSSFGWRRDPFHGRSRFHYGIDLDASVGQLISAAAGGVVSWADWNGGHGKHVEIRHPGGWVTRYSHLSQILVRTGDEVDAEDPIGLAGDTGRSTGPHLHFEIWLGGEVQDPMDILGSPPLLLMLGPCRGERGGLARSQ